MDTRARIVDTASKLFYTQGYNSTGINQIIKEAGVAKASLYQHFPSKEDLLVEYLETAGLITCTALNELVEKQGTPREKVLALFDFLLHFQNSTQFNGCNFLNIAAELPQDSGKIKELIRNQKNEVRQLFAKILSPVNKQHLADELYLLFDGALVCAKVYGDVWPIKSAKEVAGKLL